MGKGRATAFARSSARLSRRVPEVSAARGLQSRRLGLGLDTAGSSNTRVTLLRTAVQGHQMMLANSDTRFQRLGGCSQAGFIGD
jgi:hypothetical protein